MRSLYAILCGVALAACSRESALSPLPANVSSASVQVSVSEKLLYSFGQNAKPNDGRVPLANLIASGGALYGTTYAGGTSNAECGVGCGTAFSAATSGGERVLYRFRGGADGAGPAAGLIAIDGALFGTTRGGGGTSSVCSGGCGTVFKLNALSKTEKIVYRFNGGTDGAAPVADLIFYHAALYGTTQYGGVSTNLCSMGCGTVFRVSPNNGKSEKVIHAFNGRTDGAEPVGSLIEVNGALYGTTPYGGTRTKFCSIGCGTIFKIGFADKETVIYRFKYSPSAPDGAYPAAGLTDIAGTLYGTTESGGDAGLGTVFKVSALSGVERVVHSFYCCSTVDGVYPLAGLIAMNGTLYGTTRNGGAHGKGTVFAVTPAGAESLLYSFEGRPDGAGPQASLIGADGALYGTTPSGGTTGEGALFKVTP